MYIRMKCDNQNGIVTERNAVCIDCVGIQVVEAIDECRLNFIASRQDVNILLPVNKETALDIEERFANAITGDYKLLDLGTIPVKVNKED